MLQLLTNPVVLLAFTIGVFLAGKFVQKKTGLKLLNPILITTTLVIVVLVSTNTPYDVYMEGGRYIDFWLKPAIVALGVPLYKQLESIRRQMIPLLLAEVGGCVVGIVSVVVVAELLGASRGVVMSLSPKAVTTPIAIEISSVVGGISPLTGAVVICVGIFGAVAGFKIASILGIKKPTSAALAMGTSAHAIGTSAAVDRSKRWGAYSSLGLTINGLLTALLTPSILRLLGYDF